MFANLTVCLLGWWKCFANNYLQWAAVFTWCFINVQGTARSIKKTKKTALHGRRFTGFRLSKTDRSFTTTRFWTYRIRVGELRSRVAGVLGVVRAVHRFRHLRHVAVAVEMVHTGRLFHRAAARAHHQLHKVGGHRESKPPFARTSGRYSLYFGTSFSPPPGRTRCASPGNWPP